MINMEKEIKYSKKEFEDYTHRFIVVLSVDEDWRNDTSINVYSNCDSKEKLKEFINEKKSAKVIKFEIVHKCTKEQDELNSKLIDETLKNI